MKFLFLNFLQVWATVIIYVTCSKKSDKLSSHCILKLEQEVKYKVKWSIYFQYEKENTKNSDYTSYDLHVLLYLAQGFHLLATMCKAWAVPKLQDHQTIIETT
jgi:hypothetical protein